MSVPLFLGANLHDSFFEEGVSLDQYVEIKQNLDADGNGAVSQVEARAYLNKTPLTRAQKATMWTVINKSWKTNPYA